MLALLLAVSCNPYPLADTSGKINFDIKIERVSAGFMEVTVTPDRPGFYLLAAEKASEALDPVKYKQQFMNLMLDSAYVKYVAWRHQHLMNMEDHVADFPSHSLVYGKVTVMKEFLTPDTDYWVFCFQVNPKTNKADGDLFLKNVHTEEGSMYQDISFAYRVQGEWDYIYPYSRLSRQLVTTVPYVGVSIDSLDIRASHASSPGEYFKNIYDNLKPDDTRILTGIYVHQNNGVGDGTSKTNFVEGHTYYTCMSVLDGPLSDGVSLYRFKYIGKKTKLEFNHTDSLGMDEW